MIQLSSLMWACAIFFAFLGFLRGWNRELTATSGIVLVLFALFQFDQFLRGTIFLILTREQIFLVQAGSFVVMTFIMYQARELGRRRNEVITIQDSILGGLVGFFNGYVVGGALWYFLDINEYPFPQFVTAPAVTSPSAQALNQIPIVMVSGGVSGTSDAFGLIVVVLLFIVLVLL